MKNELTALEKNAITEKRQLMLNVNRSGGKLIAIQSMALRISDLDPSDADSLSLIIALSESIGLIAEEAHNELNRLANIIMDK